MAKATRQELDPLPAAPTRSGSRGSSPAPATPGCRARRRTRTRNFPGDETTDWDRASGLASLTTDMLNRAVGGAYGYATDIGGYFDYTDAARPPRSSSSGGPSGPRSARSSGCTAAAGTAPTRRGRTTRRRCGSTRSSRACTCGPGRCSTQLWKQAERDRRTADPAAVVAGPATTAQGWHQDQEWLLGTDLLVAPVVTQGATSRQGLPAARAAGSCTARATELSRRPHGHRARRASASLPLVQPLRDRAAGLTRHRVRRRTPAPGRARPRAARAGPARPRPPPTGGRGRARVRGASRARR